MKTFVLNLLYRKDRLEEMKLHSALTMPEEHEVFEATDGSKAFESEKSKRMRGHLGCWDSHRRLMEKIKDQNNGMTLVLEDDCDFVKEYAVEFAEWMKELPEDWDLIYLGGVNQDDPEKYSQHWDYARNILQTHAYIVRDKFIPTIHQALVNHPWKVDIVFSEAIKNGKCFIASPVMAVQRASFSNISNS